MKLALYQGPATCGDIEAGFNRLQTRLSAAAMAGASMAVFSELFLPGYNLPDLHRSLAQPLGGQWCQRLSDLAANAGCGLTVGWTELDGENVYNAATAFGTRGEILGHYRKIQLFGPMEKASFAFGERYTTFDFCGRKTAILICYDIEFPQHCRALADRGVSLVLVPTANPRRFEHVSHAFVPSRAAEAGLTIAYANYCGPEGDITFGGKSLIAGPDGKALASAGTGETLLVADLAPVSDIPWDLLSRQDQDYREGKFQ
ncbi:carbon-nitrogen hydrolase family protein [Labrenzia sp. 011]|uniref:carbon-nitrogen hydrolase family protein n=1 Tax=Labrenzia sp. 011 TaxID=2171494 RepID=UPI000D524526|nr:carbon-nitrogen hydrolase family protein [Labrenzia sp. 011]PVB59539.1 nitrilase [Labrenzia sp. 011]